MDEPGRKATEKVARLLKTGKTKIVTLPAEYNDVNEMLMAGKQQEFKDAWFGAKTYTPSGLVSVSDQKDRYLDRPKKLSIPFPWQGMNRKLDNNIPREKITKAEYGVNLPDSGETKSEVIEPATYL